MLSRPLRSDVSSFNSSVCVTLSTRRIVSLGASTLFTSPIGEVKSVDAPKLTILRVDSVTQTLELNEDTSLRRGRDSITMADIQPGDHIFARGVSANDVFVPKGVNVIPPEQWKRMQEMISEGGEKRGGTRQSAPAPSAPPAPAAPPPAQNPPERRN